VTVGVLVVVVVSALLLPPFVREYLRMAGQPEGGPSEGRQPEGEPEFFAPRGKEPGSSRSYPEGTARHVPIPLAVPRSSEFATAFAYCVEEALPFKPEEVNQSFVDFNFGLRLSGDVDYLLLFLDAPCFDHYYAEGFPPLAELLGNVGVAEVCGIIERTGGRFSVFARPDEVGAELQRLRKADAVLESAP